jgi:cardiolipin synthase
MPATAAPEVVLAPDYIPRILPLIQSAKKRITLAAMVVRAGPATEPVLHACIDAARRGVAVHVVADVFGQHDMHSLAGVSHKIFKQQCAQTRELLNEIHALGGTVDWVGRIGLNPYAGRYHCKATIIDDYVFSFGGINFCDDALGNIDYMVHVKNPGLAAKLSHTITSMPALDIEVAIDAKNSFLYDAGKKGDSIIYDRACQLAAVSKKVTYISQMCPSGKLADVLKTTQSVCYFNQPGKTGLGPSSLAQLWDTWRTKTVNHYEGDAYIHAKCMLFELNDGSKVVLSGSHNFSWRGVAFGTKEIALQSSDPALWRRLHDVVFKVAADA